MIKRHTLKKEKIMCKEAAKMVIPYIQEQLAGKELKNFVNHIKDCPECREELETYYIVYKGLMQLDEKEELPMNMVEALNAELNYSDVYLRNMSLFYILAEILKWLVNGSCILLLISKIMEMLWRIRI